MATRTKAAPATRVNAWVTALLAAAAMVALPAATAHAAITPAARPARPVPPSSPSARVAADAAAMAQAQATRRPVTVTANTTQTSLTIAHPNGTFSMTLSPAPVRVRAGGRWRPIDPALHRTPTGRWTPAAVPSGVTLSGGGTSPLAVLTSPDGGQLALTFPARLPAPVITDATATYRSVLPGTDLQVSATVLGGIREVLIIHDAAAAADPLLRHLRLGLAARTLRVATDAAGNLRATGPGGRLEFNGPPPSMWNSAHRPGPASQPSAGIPASSPAGPGRGAAAATVPAHITGDTWALTPGPRLLSGSTASYPVYLSASITASPSNCNTVGSQYEECQAGYDETQEACPKTLNYNIPQGSDPYIGEAVGYDPGPPNFSSSCAPGEDRSFYAFDTSGLSTSMNIINATMTAWIRYGADWNCSDTHPLRVKLTYQINSNTNWSNQPDVSSYNQTQATTVTSGPNSNQNPVCAEPVASFGGIGYAVSLAASLDWPNITFGFFGGSDSAGLDWMRIGDYPDIITTFDLTPDAPTGMTTIPAPQDTPNGPADNGCGASPSSYGWIGASASGMALSAAIQSDISSEPVRALYSATDDTTGQAIPSPAGYDSSEDPGSQGSYSHWYSSGSATTNTGINFTLQDGHTYTWSVQTEVQGIPGDPGYPDGPYDSSPSQSCGFNVDLTPPAQPAVTSTAFPPSGSGRAGQDAGTSGTFTFTSTDPPPAGCTGTVGCQASGVYEFEYSLNTPLPASPLTPGCSNGQTTGAVLVTSPTSCTVPVSRWGTNTLYVAAIDKAGNVSQACDYTFYAPWNPATKVTLGDIDGDGIPDLLGTTSTDLIFYPGNTDTATAPATASTEDQTPDGTAWNNYQITHRGSMNPQGTVDDLFAHKNNGADLYLYINQYGQQGTGTGLFFRAQSQLIAYTAHPACSSMITDCSTYNTGNWSNVSQILAPGDAWCPAPGTSCSSSDTGLPSLITVENANGQLWLYQGEPGDTLQNPVKLGNATGTTTWAGMTLLAPGNVNGQLTLWALDNATGAIYSYPIYLTSSGVPTINPNKTTTPVAATSGPTITGISLPAATYPAVASTGPLDGDTGSTSDPGSYPGLFAETTTGTTPNGAPCTTGCLWYYPGQNTSNGTQPPLTNNPAFVGTLHTLITQLS